MPKFYKYWIIGGCIIFIVAIFLKSDIYSVPMLITDKDDSGKVRFTATYPSSLSLTTPGSGSYSFSNHAFSCWDDANVLRISYIMSSSGYIDYATSSTGYNNGTYIGPEKLGNNEYQVFDDKHSQKYYVRFLPNGDMFEATDYYGRCGGKNTQRGVVPNILKSIEFK